jgi:uncharacterized membrane protein YphA (DoxX/SURF4 family)
MPTPSTSLGARKATAAGDRSTRPLVVADWGTRPLTSGTSGFFQGAVVALIRIAMGLFWYQESMLKLPGHSQYFAQLMRMVGSNSFVPGYAGIMQKVLIPHAAQFAIFVWLLEGFIALSLLFGVLTRLGGTVGAIWSALLFAGMAYASGPSGRSSGPGAWYFGFMVLMCALLALAAGGRTLGVDRWLRPVMLRRAARGDRVARYVALAE